MALYKYENEWTKSDIEGTLFVYERKCEPSYGFLILNRLSATNLVQPITKDIELQDKSPFLLYKIKVRYLLNVFGMYFDISAHLRFGFYSHMHVLSTLYVFKN